MRPGVKEAFESAQDRLGAFTIDEFDQAIKDFEVYPQSVDDRICGAIIVFGNEMHACILPRAKGRWVNRKAIRLFNSIIDKYGSVTTSATTADGLRFVQSLGFIEDNGIFRSTRKWASNHS